MLQRSLCVLVHKTRLDADIARIRQENKMLTMGWSAKASLVLTLQALVNTHLEYLHWRTVSKRFARLIALIKPFLEEVLN